MTAALISKMAMAPKDRPRVQLECIRLLVKSKLDPQLSKRLRATQADVTKQIAVLSLEELELLGEDLLDFTSPGELKHWLAARNR